MATSIIRCHAFSGTSEEEPPCFLLQVDDFHCLLDCGWDSRFSDNYVQQVAKYTKIIDAVFISHSDIRHMGALPYLFGKCGLNCPVYMTGPVHRMGHLFLYDAYLSMCKTEEFMKFDLDDVDGAFDLAVDMKYQQTKNLHGRGQGVSVTPYVAGHMIGGAIWKIVKDDLEIVYAIDYNHKKENHLNGAMFSDIQRPHLLITSSYHTFQKTHKKYKEDHLKQIIQETMKKNGNILILSDTGGRSLELSYLLDKMWRNQKSCLMPNGLAFISEVAFNVIEFAKSNVEWLSDELTHGFESAGFKPFQFRYMSICHCLDDLKTVAKPMVTIVSQSHLNYGFGRELISKWCEDENNLIIVTAKNREQCLTTELLKYSQNNDVNREVFNISIKEEYRLNSDEFFMKLTKESLISADPNLRSQSILDNNLEMVDDMSSDEEDSSKMDWDNAANTNALIKKDVTFLPQDDNRMSSNDGSGFHFAGFDIYPDQYLNSGSQWFRAAQRLILVFPSSERKVVWDLYGEHVDVKDPNFLHTAGSSYAMDVINQKLMWDDVNRLKSGSVMRKYYESNNSLIDVGNVRDKLMNVFDSGIEPTITLPSLKDITVKCDVIFEDYEGLSDLAAIQQTLTNCKPQEIIIIGGSKQDSATISDFCRTNLNMKKNLVHVPVKGQVVNCTKEGHIYQARMSDALVSSLSFQRVGNYELAWLNAVIKMPTNNNNTSASDNEQDSLVEVDQIPILELPEPGNIPEHNTIFINEPKLSDLKQLLIKKGMNAEFNGGVLVVDNCVAIKKNESGKLLLEGTFCDTYFEVREVLYSQFAIL